MVAVALFRMLFSRISSVSTEALSFTIQSSNKLTAIGHGNAYSLDIDSYWSSMSAVSGNGVELSNITVKNWKGTEANGAQRGPIKIICPNKAPCYNILIEDFAMWTETGSKQWYSCQSAYGSGFCLKSGSQHTSYAVTTTTISSAPSGYSAAKMPLDLTTDFGSTKSIPIPTIPTTFYPGATPHSALMSKRSTKAAKARAVDMSIETPAAASEQVVQAASQETGQPSPESAGPDPSGTPGPVPAGGNRPSRHRHGHHHSGGAA
jgi:rhamnogalacturonan hydrolase